MSGVTSPPSRASPLTLPGGTAAATAGPTHAVIEASLAAEAEAAASGGGEGAAAAYGGGDGGGEGSGGEGGGEVTRAASPIPAKYLPRVEKMSSALPDNTAPSARPMALWALAAHTRPGAPPEHRGGLPCAEDLASGRPKVEDSPLANLRYHVLSELPVFTGAEVRCGH